MTVRIAINCDNAAFRDDDDTGLNEAATGAQVALIIRDLAKHVEGGVHERTLHDSNGNRVGSVTVEE